MSASAPGSLIERTKAETRPSSPRSSRISSTIARYSRSSSRVRRVSGVARPGARRPRRAGCPCASVWAAPATPRCRPLSATARPPPGSRTRSVTSATVPTFAYSLSWRGTSSTRSSVPDIDGQRHVHVGEDDDVFQGYEQHRAQLITPCSSVHTHINYKKHTGIPSRAVAVALNLRMIRSCRERPRSQPETTRRRWARAFGRSAASAD